MVERSGGFVRCDRLDDAEQRLREPAEARRGRREHDGATSGEAGTCAPDRTEAYGRPREYPVDLVAFCSPLARS